MDVYRRTLTAWIFIAMLVGAAVGHDFPNVATNLRVLALIFLRLIKTIIAPLIFGTLVVGIAGHSNLRQVGRLGLRSIIYFEIVTTIAIFLGLAAINISQAGVGVQLPALPTTETVPVTKLSAQDTILHIFPENIAKSVADGAVLEVVVFSLIFAVALAMISEQKRRPMLAFCESLSEVMFKFTNLVMYMAPLGVGAAVAYTVGHTGTWRARQPAEAAADVLRRAYRIHSGCPAAGRADVPGPPTRVRPGRGRAGDHRFCHRPVPRLRCLAPWRPWRPSAFRGRSSRSSSPPATASTWMAARCIFLSPPSSSPRSRAFIFRWDSNCMIMLTLMLTSKGIAGVSRRRCS